jgi:hypothetical protein
VIGRGRTVPNTASPYGFGSRTHTSIGDAGLSRKGLKDSAQVFLTLGPLVPAKHAQKAAPNPADAGCNSQLPQYSNTPILQYSNTRSLRVAGFEDDDDDEDEGPLAPAGSHKLYVHRSANLR